MAAPTDWAKIGLSAAGVVLLIALCAQLLFGDETNETTQIFAAVFMVLIVYAFRRFAKSKKR